MAGYRRWIVLSMLVLMPGGLWGLHQYLGRPQRIEAELRNHDLLTVRDQILRFEYEQETALTSLDQLIPGFLQDEHLTETDGTPRYEYNKKKRILKEIKNLPVGGLYTSSLQPLMTRLPNRVPDLDSFSSASNQSDNTLNVLNENNTDQNTSATNNSSGNEKQTNLTQEKTPPLEQESVDHQSSKTPDISTDDITITNNPTLNASDPIKTTSIKDMDIQPRIHSPKSPKLLPTPNGALVFEAEHFTEMNFGWEVHEDPACGGGAYLHCKEGTANTEGQVHFRLGNFYGTGNKREPTYLRYHLNIPASKRYRLFARFWATGYHCSNKIWIEVDRPRWSGHELGSRLPYRWQWSSWLNGTVHFSKGDHFLNISIHEDGVRIDQFMLVPTSVSSDKAFTTNLEPGRNTAWKKSSKPFHISYDIESVVLSEEQPPDCRVILRRLTDQKGSAKIRVTLKEAGPNGTDLVLLNGPLNLDKLQEISVLPVPLDAINIKALPRREYLLKTEILVNEKPVSEAWIPLLKPFQWQIFGPGGYLSNYRKGPLDGIGQPKKGDKRTWQPFKAKAWNHYGVLDFGVHFDKNSLHPRSTGTLYAQTNIQVPKDGTYLFKIQADDQIRLWLDGKECYRNESHRPVSRSAGWHKQHLTKGSHTLRMRVNQRGGRWQASLRIRTINDQVSNVIGTE